MFCGMWSAMAFSLLWRSVCCGVRSAMVCGLLWCAVCYGVWSAMAWGLLGCAVCYISVKRLSRYHQEWFRKLAEQLFFKNESSTYYSKILCFLSIISDCLQFLTKKQTFLILTKYRNKTVKKSKLKSKYFLYPT